MTALSTISFRPSKLMTAQTTNYPDLPFANNRAAASRDAAALFQ